MIKRQQQIRYGDTIRSQHAAFFSLSVSKTLHVKRSRLVSIGKIPMFLILRHKKTILNICMNKVSKKLRKAVENAEKN